ncbi:hypothetical protein CPT_Seabear_022 [Salmonella phage Seabear]|uniref:Uncharacterized protein n=1 Tax=Salmonella phage Stitch TaxID=2991861 RepID=A0A0A0RWB8_9CAUD|nr:hypothetical protein CPT_Stitch17 [Salmonella phage Stitch]AIW03968.1 hypothetical protein CPT_Stitch17 [Salmonella phage Stitch]QCQ65338.1 hypothetical protein CPT_Seabear_022 [Salmonella phage Seabear]
MFTQQTIKVVADHELDTWDYSFKDLTATVQFKSMQLSFLHIDLQACKEFQAKLMNARKIFGTARIPADNLINALIDAGYKLVKTEVNRPSTPVTIRDPWQSGPIAMLNNSDKRLMSDMHNVPCGGVVSNTQSYKFGEDCSPSVQLKHTQEALESDMRSVAPADAGVSRNSYTIHLSTPSSRNESFADAVMEALVDLTNSKGFN